MPRVAACELPGHALLDRYREDHYTDCFYVDLPGAVSLQGYVEAFYCSWLFKSERLVLRWAVSKPSTDEQARQLANGEISAFAAWTVEDRSDHQLLMCDFRSTTRSWLMVEPLAGSDREQTRLYFGSAVISTEKAENGTAEMGRSFKWLLGLHKLYSRLLLGAASRRLRG